MSKFNNYDLIKSANADAGDGPNNQVGKIFPIKSHRYKDIHNHPALEGGSRKNRKVEFKVSQQEEKRIEGLINTLQCKTKADVIRIAIYEAHKALSEAEQHLCRGNALSKIAGHTGRSRMLSVKVTTEDINRLKEIAKAWKVNEKTAARTAMIFLSIVTRSDRKEWRNLSGCKKLNQGEAMNLWKAQKKEAGEWSDDAGSSLGALKGAHQEALDEGSAENDYLYALRGEMARYLCSQGLRLQVYPNQLDAILAPHLWGGIDDEADRMDTDFVDQHLFEAGMIDTPPSGLNYNDLYEDDSDDEEELSEELIEEILEMFPCQPPADLEPLTIPGLEHKTAEQLAEEKTQKARRDELLKKEHLEPEEYRELMINTMGEAEARRYMAQLGQPWD